MCIPRALPSEAHYPTGARGMRAGVMMVTERLRAHIGGAVQTDGKRADDAAAEAAAQGKDKREKIFLPKISCLAFRGFSGRHIVNDQKTISARRKEERKWKTR